MYAACHRGRLVGMRREGREPRAAASARESGSRSQRRDNKPREASGTSFTPTLRTPRRGRGSKTVRLRVRAEGAQHPVRPPPLALRRARQGQPALEDLVRLVGVHVNVPVAVLRLGPRDFHLLMPAVAPAHRIGLHGKGQVLMHPGVGPPDAFGVGVGGLVRGDALALPEVPSAVRLLQLHQRGGHAARPFSFGQPPAAEVVRAGDDAGADSLGDPDLVHEVADLGPNANEIAGCQTEPRGIGRVHPGRVGVGDLDQPLRVGAARVDQGREAIGREQDELVRRAVDGVRMDVASNVLRDRELRPAELRERRGVELELARGSAEAKLRRRRRSSRRSGRPSSVATGAGVGTMFLGGAAGTFV